MRGGAGGLVGRQQEVDLVTSMLGGEPRAVVLGGEAGVGKTRLSQAVAEGWAGAGGTVEWVDGAAGRSAIPFAAVVRLLPEITVPSPDPAAHAAELVRQAVAMAAQQPDRLIVVDDAHELDEQSALLVHHLVLGRAAPVVITVRSGEEVPGPLATLWRNRHAERIDVLPLSAPETRVLVESLVGGETDAATAAAVFRASEGNPLLLGELVRDAVGSGSLRLDDGAWRWDGGIGRAVHLREVVGARLARIDPAVRRILLLLALGEPIGLTVINRLAPDADVDEAEARALVRIERDGDRHQVRLAHPLIGEVLLAATPASELRPLRIALADEIAAAGARRRPDRLIEAELRVAAGDVAQPDHLLAAATDALEIGVGDLGLRLADAAIGAGADPIARVVRGESLLLSGREQEAVAELEAVLPDLDCDADRVRAAQALQHAHHRMGDQAAVDEVIRRAESLLSDQVWLAILEGNSIQHLMMSGHTGEAWDRSERLLAQHDDPRVRLRLVSSVGTGRALGGRTGAAMELVSEMLPDALRLQSELPLAPTWVLNANAIAMMLGGQLDEATTFIETLGALVHSGSASAGATAPWLLVFCGRIELLRGRAPVAAELLEQAAEAFGPGDIGGFYPWARSLQAEALALLGRIDEARVAADLAAANPSHMAIYETEARRARAWVRALRGEVTNAVADLVELAGEQERERQWSLVTYTLNDAVRLGGGREVIDRLADALPHADGRWAEALVVHLEARRTGSGADLERAGEAFAAMGAYLHGAEAFAAASIVHDRATLRARAAAAARRRDELVAACGPVSTPALRGGVERVGLTRREQEVVDLAATGLSNREIAERLFVSLRTAEGHLHRAFVKLGVSDRSELAEVLARP